jgi:thioredoxin reductase
MESSNVQNMYWDGRWTDSGDLALASPFAATPKELDQSSRVAAVDFSKKTEKNTERKIDRVFVYTRQKHDTETSVAILPQRRTTAHTSLRIHGQREMKTRAESPTHCTTACD